MSVPHSKQGNLFCTCAKDHIIDEKDQYKAIGLRGFDCKLFGSGEDGGTREGLDRYPYLKHIIQLCPGDRVKQMEKMNEVNGMKNRVTVGGGGKRIVLTFRRQDLWKFVGCVLSAVTYVKK